MWDSSFLTTRGLHQIARAEHGETMTITHVTSGRGTSPVQDLRNLNAPVDETTETVSIVHSKVLDTGVQLKLQITNATEAYTCHQIGIWAHIGDEADELIAIYQDDEGIRIPSAEEMPEFVYNLYAIIENLHPGQLQVQIDSSAYLTTETAEEWQAEYEGQLNDAKAQLDAKLQAATDTLDEKLSSATQALDDAIKSAQQELSDLLGGADEDLREKLEAAGRALDSALEALEDAQNLANEALEKAEAAMNKLLSEAQTTMDGKISEAESKMDAKLAEADESLRGTLEAAQQALTDAEAAVDEKLAQAQQALDSANAQMDSKLSEADAAMQEKLDAAAQALSDAKAEMESLIADAEERMNAKLGEFDLSNYALKTDLDSAKNDLQAQIDELSGKSAEGYAPIQVSVTTEGWVQAEPIKLVNTPLPPSEEGAFGASPSGEVPAQRAEGFANSQASPAGKLSRVSVTEEVPLARERIATIDATAQPYYHTFPAPGVNPESNMAYIANLIQQGTEAIDSPARGAWGSLIRGAVTNADEITLWASEAPTAVLNMQLIPVATKEPVTEIIGILGGGGTGGAAGKDISRAEVTLSAESFVYTGQPQEPTVTKVMLGDVELTPNEDYYALSSKQTDVGEYNIVIAGIINYSGSIVKPWQITRADPQLTLSAETANITGVMGTVNSEITVTHAGDGAITFEVTDGEDGGSVTAALQDKAIRLTSVKAGTCTVKVKLAQGSNHTAAEKSIAVTITKATGSISVAPTELVIDGDAGSTAEATLTVIGDGAISVTGGESYVTGKVDETRKKLTLTTVAATEEPQTLTVTLAATDNYTGATCTVKVTIQNGKIYGVTWDGTASTKWSRTDDAVGFTDPVPYDAGTHKTDYSSPFDACKPWSEMKRETDATCGEMVRIPKFWYELKQNGNGLSIRISDHAEEGFLVAPAFMQRNSTITEADYILVGRYHCDSNYKSTTKVKPKASITRDAARKGIAALDSSTHRIWQLDFATWFTIWLLYLVEFADWGSQEKIGYGCGNGSSTENSGSTDSMPYHTGTMQTNKTTYGVGVQYRYIEDPWANVYDWLDGCYYSTNGLYIVLDPTKFSDSIGGTLVGKPTSGYPSKLTVQAAKTGTFGMFIPTTSSGSESTYTCDYWYFGGSTYPVLCVGGSYYQGRDFGLFCVNDRSASYSSSSIGARLLKIPSGGV